MNLLTKWRKIFEYKRTAQYKKLNYYSRRIRQLKPLSEKEWANFKQLAEKELDFYNSLKQD